MERLKGVQNFLHKKSWLIVVVLAVFFLPIYSWLYISTPDIFNSPDETANYVFINHFIQNSDLHIKFDKNPNNAIHPRSVNIVQGSYVPGFFIGLIIIVGSFGKIFGEWAILFLPSFVAVLGVIAYFALIKRIFDEKIALISALLLFFLPQWWHYASRGFLPNVLFLSLLLISGYGVVRSNELALKHKPHLWVWLSWSVIAGISLGGAFAIRPSELWWVIILFLVPIIYKRKAVRLRVVVICFVCFLLALIPFGYWQQATFGGFFVTGYDQLTNNQINASPSSNLSFVFKSIFPFGLNIMESLQRFATISLKLFWWQICLVVIGLVAFFKSKQKNQGQKLYASVLALISLYLILYYGAWIIADDIDVNRLSIGLSYVRYWLPVYMGIIPFSVLGINVVGNWISKKKATLVQICLISLVCVGSTVFVFTNNDDNLGRIKKSIVEYNSIRDKIITITEKDAVIISERNDKIFWPIRQVIHYQDQDFGFIENLNEISKIYPVYWFTILPETHVREWEQRIFLPKGLSLTSQAISSPDYFLFKIENFHNDK